MTIIRKFIPGTSSASETAEKPLATDVAGNRPLMRVICSSDAVDRGGDIIVQSGIQLGGYQRNPVVLWSHDKSVPIAGAVSVGVVNGKLEALIQFPPAGVVAKSDEIYGCVQNGVISAISIGFLPLRSEPIDKTNPVKGPRRYLSVDLMEISFVSVPANSDAVVIGRALYSGRSADLDLKQTIKGLRQRRLREVEVLRLALVLDPPANSSSSAASNEHERQRLIRLRQIEVLGLNAPI